jgi:hypothetical protein
MKARLLKLSAFAILLTLFFGCCEDCEKERDQYKAQLEQANKSSAEIVELINGAISNKFEAFRDIKLPIFLGKTRNNFQQHLHIEGGIENPFFIVGKFKSEISADGQNCTIEDLELEILPTRRGTSVKIKDYQFDINQPIKLFKKDGQLKIMLTIIQGAVNTKVNVSIDNGKIDVKNEDILDINVTKKGFGNNSNNISIGDKDFAILCCEPVICKSIITYP